MQSERIPEALAKISLVTHSSDWVTSSLVHQSLCPGECEIQLAGSEPLLSSLELKDETKPLQTSGLRGVESRSPKVNKDPLRNGQMDVTWQK